VEIIAMTVRNQLFVSGTLAVGEPTTPIPNWIASIGQRLVAWAQYCVDSREAAALYEELVALSDAELTRRGLSRASLAQDVRATCERSAGA
jgi:hypothetical protein